MRIVVIGAGAVGSYLAERLSLEGQDVVVIESDPKRAAEVQEEAHRRTKVRFAATEQKLERLEAERDALQAKLPAKVSRGLGAPMTGIDMDELEPSEMMQTRGW